MVQVRLLAIGVPKVSPQDLAAGRQVGAGG
jgi:hypothetical protein